MNIDFEEILKELEFRLPTGIINLNEEHQVTMLVQILRENGVDDANEYAQKARAYFGFINEAAENLDPSKVAIYAFNLAKLFNTFYAELSIANAESEIKKQVRIQLGILTAATLQKAMSVLGIAVPEQM